MEGVVENESPFLLKLKNGDEDLYTISVVDSSQLPKRSVSITDNTKKAIKLDATLSLNPDVPTDFMVAGKNWNGKLVLVSKIPVWKIDVVKTENSQETTVGYAEWRNMRDEKLEIKDPKEDCAFIASLIIGLRRIQTKLEKKSLYFK